MSAETSGVIADTNDVITNMAVVSPANEKVCDLPAIDSSKLLITSR